MAAASAAGKSRSSSVSRSGPRAGGSGRSPRSSRAASLGHRVEHAVGAGLEDHHVLAAPDQQHRAVDRARAGTGRAARRSAAGPVAISRAVVARSAKWEANVEAIERVQRRPAGGRRAACRPRRRPRCSTADGTGTGEASTARSSGSRSITANQRAMSRPAGATGTIPARSRSSRSASSSDTQPPSELPHTIAPPSGAIHSTAAAAKRSSWGRIGSSAASRSRGAEAGQVERHGAAAGPAEAVEQQPPGVGAVGVAVQQQERRPVALQLQRARLVPRQRQPVLEQRLHPAQSRCECRMSATLA